MLKTGDAHMAPVADLLSVLAIFLVTGIEDSRIKALTSP
jgi:hypothetical protein